MNAFPMIAPMRLPLRRCMVREIQAITADYYGIGLEHMTSPLRERSVSRPRQIAMYLARTVIHKSYPEIGRLFKRDHSTAIHAVWQIKKLIGEDKAVAAQVSELEAML